MPAFELNPRDYYDYGDCYYSGGYRYCNRRSAWNDWVRWVVLAVVIIGFFLLFVLCSCITARRRRKAGAQPFYGTGWAARPGQQQNAQPYYNNNYTAPPPQYTPAPGQGQNSYYGTPGANQGYYGGQQNGVELQSPQPTYNRTPGTEPVYQPPMGPPPTKA